MSYRIVYTPSAKLKGGGGDTTPPVESYELGPKIKAAIATGTFYALGLWVLLTAIWAVILILAAVINQFPPLPWVLGVEGLIIAVALFLGLLVISKRGYEWAQQAATRPWDVDDAVRARQWKLEDDEITAARQAIEDAKKGTPDAKGAPTASGDRLHTVAMNVLMRHYLGGQLTTRDAMATVEKVCTQPEWNYVNQTMKAIGLKKKNKLREDMDFAMAVETWWANVDIREDGYLWVQTDRGQWKALVEIA